MLASLMLRCDHAEIKNKEVKLHFRISGPSGGVAGGQLLSLVSRRMTAVAGQMVVTAAQVPRVGECVQILRRLPEAVAIARAT